VTNAIQDVAYLRFDDPVIDVDSVPPRLHDVPSSHLRQVLGHDGLREAQTILNIPHRLFTVFQKLEDPESVRVPHDFDGVRSLGESYRINGPDQSFLVHDG